MARILQQVPRNSISGYLLLTGSHVMLPFERQHTNPVYSKAGTFITNDFHK